MCEICNIAQQCAALAETDTAETILSDGLVRHLMEQHDMPQLAAMISAETVVIQQQEVGRG